MSSSRKNFLGSLEHRIRLPRRWRIATVSILVLALLASLGWYGIEHYVLGIERYRPQIERKLSDSAGFPATVGHIDLVLLPSPHLNIEEVRIGTERMYVAIEQAAATVPLRKLLDSTVDILGASIYGVRLRVPSDPQRLKAEWAKRVPRTPPADPSRFTVELDALSIAGVEVCLDDETDPVLEARIEVSDPLSSEIGVAINAQAMALEGEPGITVDAVVHRDAANRVSADVEAKLTGALTAAFAPDLPAGAVEIALTAKGLSRDKAEADLKGVLTAVDEDDALAAAASGPFSAKLWFKDGALTVNDVVLDTPGLVVAADATRHADGEWACHVREAVVTRAAMEALAAELSETAVRLHPEADAELRISEFLFGKRPGHELRLVSGNAHFGGLALVSPEAVLLPDIRGEMQVQEGAFQITNVETEGISVAGSVRPDMVTGDIAVEARGEIRLTHERLARLVSARAIKDVGGTVSLSRVEGTIRTRRPAQSTFAVEGAIADGLIVLNSENFTDRIAGLNGTFTTDLSTVGGQLLGTSERFGPFTTSGKYLVRERVWEGELEGAFSGLDPWFISGEFVHALLQGYISAHGNLRTTASLEFPTQTRRTFRMRFDRADGLPLTAAVDIVETAAGWKLGDMTIGGTAPLEAVRAALPATVQAEGPAEVVFRRTREPARFTTDVDLAGAHVALPPQLAKRPGVSASVHVAGAAVPGDWDAEILRVTCAGESLVMEFAESGLVAENAAVNLAPLSALLPEETKATGEAVASFTTEPMNVAVTLRDAALLTETGIEADSITGLVRYAEAGGWALDNVRVAGARSDFLINARQHGDAWEGTLEGSRFDVDAVEEMFSTAASIRRAREVNEAQDEPLATPWEPWRVSGEVNLDTLTYRRATFHDVRAVADTEDTVVYLSSVYARSYDGTISGTARLEQRADAPILASVDLQLNAVDGRTIDELMFLESRELAGTVEGALKVTAPVGAGVNLVNGASGDIVFTARNGTLGQMGLASKILSALRTTELVILRFPALPQKGLTFDSCRSTLTMVDGIMSVDEFRIVNPSYTMDVTGYADFPKDNLDLNVQINLLSPVTAVVRQIPGVGQKINEQTSVMLIATGPPSDPEVLYKAGPVTRPVKGVAGVGEEILVDGILGGTGKVLEKVLGVESNGGGANE